MTLTANNILKAGEAHAQPAFRVTLDSQDRHIRRRRLQLNDGTSVLVSLEKAVQLDEGDCLVLDNGQLVEVRAAHEDLLEITARSAKALVVLAWHIGNRHLEAQIEESRILIRPDHVIAHMLEHQGAVVKEVREAFSPENGAYHHDAGFEHDFSLTGTSGHGHSHSHGPDRPHDDDDGDDH